MFSRRALLMAVLAPVLAIYGCAPAQNRNGRHIELQFSSAPEQIPMPTEEADLFEVDVPENWTFQGFRHRREPYMKMTRFEPVEPPASVVMEQWPGDMLPGGLAEDVGVRHALSREEVLRYFAGLISVNIVDHSLLPDREVGGERALGWRYRVDHEKGEGVNEEWCVVRHDGVWLFRLFGGRGRDVIGDDVYQILDSFRWTGPARSDPSASES